MTYTITGVALKGRAPASPSNANGKRLPMRGQARRRIFPLDVGMNPTKRRIQFQTAQRLTHGSKENHMVPTMDVADCYGETDACLGLFDTLEELAPLNPDTVASRFDHDSGVPVAVICLLDCRIALAQTRYALHQVCAHRVGSALPPQLSLPATWRQEFYLQDVALRLYSAAEHAAEAIVLMRGLSDADFAAVKSRASRWVRVCRAMKRSRPNDPIFSRMQALGGSKPWKRAMTYRNNIVHQQPDRLRGLGIQYSRRKRWQEIAVSRHVLLARASGDPPDTDAEEMRQVLIQGFADFVAVAHIVKTELLLVLERQGVTIDGATGTVISGAVRRNAAERPPESSGGGPLPG